MTETPAGLNQREIADLLGFSLSAVKKWRKRTLAVLTAAGQLDSQAPNVLLPTNALPLPVNQKEHVRDGAIALFDPVVIEKWAKRTQRKDPVTGATTHPLPPGKVADPDKPPRVRRPPSGAARRSRCSKHGPFAGDRCTGCPVSVAA